MANSRRTRGPRGYTLNVNPKAPPMKDIDHRVIGPRPKSIKALQEHSLTYRKIKITLTKLPPFKEEDD